MQISSKNKKILVLSDFHQEVDKFKKILAHEKADINVFCGDEYDSHTHDSMYDAEKTAKFMRLWVFDPKNIALFGNHTLPYIYINKYTQCSGYSQSKNNLIDEIWGARKWEIVDKYKWYVWVDNFLISHAGLSPVHLHPKIDVTDKKALSHWLDVQIQDANVKLNTASKHWLFGAGRGRGGEQSVGGLDWLDWDSEFEPIEGLNSIQGHSHGTNIRIKTAKNSINYCIDTSLNEYIVIENGKLNIKKYIDI